MIITTLAEREYEPKWSEVESHINFITIDEDGQINAWVQEPTPTGKSFTGYWQREDRLSLSIGWLPNMNKVIDWQEAIFTRPVIKFNRDTVSDQKEWAYRHRGEYYTLAANQKGVYNDAAIYRVVHIGNGEYRMVSEKTANVWNNATLFGTESWVKVDEE
jgi:hypothetical protein